MTRKEQAEKFIDAAIANNDVSGLIERVEGYPCACKGPQDDETLCYCAAWSKQVRDAVSYAGLKRGRIVRLKVQ